MTPVWLCGKELTFQAWLLWLERPAYWVGSWLASRNLDMGRVPTTINWQRWFTRPKLLLWTTWFMLNTCFWVWNFSPCQAEAAPILSPSKNPRHWVSKDFLEGLLTCRLLGHLQRLWFNRLGLRWGAWALQQIWNAHF